MRPIIPGAFASCVIFSDKKMLRLRETSEINRDKVVGGKRNVLGEGKEAKTKGEKKKKKTAHTILLPLLLVGPRHGGQ